MRQSVYIAKFVLVIFVMLSPHIDFIDLLNTKKTMLGKISLPHTLCEVNLTLEKLTLASVGNSEPRRNLSMSVSQKKYIREFSSEFTKVQLLRLSSCEVPIELGQFLANDFCLDVGKHQLIYLKSVQHYYMLT